MSSVNTSSFLAYAVALCREGCYTLLLDLVKVVATEEVDLDDLAIDQATIEHWLREYGSQLWVVVTDIDGSREHIWNLLRFLNLLELLEETQKLGAPQLELTLSKLGISDQAFRAELHRYQMDHYTEPKEGHNIR